MREESILACLAAASATSAAQAQTLQEFVMEESEEKKRREGKKKFSNLSCYKTEKKRPQLCLLNKPLGRDRRSSASSSSAVTKLRI